MCRISVVTAIALWGAGASAAILPGNILLDPDVEMAEPGANIFNVPNGWFRSSNNLDNVSGIGETGVGPLLWGPRWTTTESVSPTHSLRILDAGLAGPFLKMEWRSFAAPIPNPAAHEFLRWSWDVLYNVDEGAPFPEFSVHMRLDGAFVGTGNLIESAGLVDHTVALTGNSGGVFQTFTMDIPIGPTHESYDIIFRTEPADASGNGATQGTMFIDNISVVPIPIPEPTSLTMLGIVGLLACQVRRRDKIHTVERQCLESRGSLG